MMYAFYNEIKIEPQPKLRGICPFCSEDVHSKCGKINAWHWAHIRNYNCDPWQENESEWHINWKRVFGIENSEVIIIKDSVKHIADIFTKNQVVIELQNSPISAEEIEERENFYGERLIWIINGKHFSENFNTLLEEQIYDYKNISWHYSDPQVFPLFRFKLLGKFPSYSYHWNRPRQTWSVAKRNVFIDFGGEDLYWIKVGLGKKHGLYYLVKKVAFVNKYFGDYLLLTKYNLI